MATGKRMRAGLRIKTKARAAKATAEMNLNLKNWVQDRNSGDGVSLRSIVPPTQLDRIEAFLRTGADMTERVREAELMAAYHKNQYNILNDRLAALLTKDQLEAARVCGCAPAVYAIEFIELQKPRIFPSEHIVESTSWVGG